MLLPIMTYFTLELGVKYFVLKESVYEDNFMPFLYKTSSEFDIVIAK